MSDEKSTPGSKKAAAGSGGQLGPTTQPTNEVFEGANNTPGDVFGDKSPRDVPDKGADLALGLSECVPFENESLDDLGMGRNDATGKPLGPDMSAVNNGGAGAKLRFG